MVSKLESGNKIVGVKQVKRALQSETAELVYIAEDAESNVIEEIVETCTEKQIQVCYVGSMEELGNVCGIDVNAAVAALIK